MPSRPRGWTLQGFLEPGNDKGESVNPEFLKTLLGDLVKVKALLKAGKTIDAYIYLLDLENSTEQVLARLGVKKVEE
jgi:hypothetical protein